MAKINLDPSFIKKMEPQGTALAPGWYCVMIESNEMKPNSKGTGTLLVLRGKILAPEKYKGKPYSQTINVAHSNATAQRIGQEQIGALVQALGIQGFQDTDQLNGHHVAVSYRLNKFNDTDINGWKPSNELTADELAQTEAAEVPVRQNIAPAQTAAQQSPAPWQATQQPGVPPQMPGPSMMPPQAQAPPAATPPPAFAPPQATQAPPVATQAPPPPFVPPSPSQAEPVPDEQAQAEMKALEEAAQGGQPAPPPAWLQS